MTIEYRSFSFTPTAGTETRSADATGDKLAGHAIVYNRESHDLGGFVEIVAPGALTRSLKQASAGELNVHALWSHDSSQPLGSTRGGKLALSSDDEGLAFELDTSRFTPAQLDAARDGDLQMSFGFRVVKDSWVRRDDGVAERTLIDVDLFEVSPVISPAYPDTTAALRSLEAWKADEAGHVARKLLDQTAPQGEGAALIIDPTKVHVDASTSMAARTTFLDSRFSGGSSSSGLLSTVVENNSAKPKENVTLKIKRELTKKAIEQHLQSLAAIK